MDLQPYIEEIHRQLATSAEAGGEEARALAARLTAPLDSAMRLALQDSLSAAAQEITSELAPGSVELRLRGREPEFVVTPPPAGPAAESAEGALDEQGPVGWRTASAALQSAGDEGGGMARINLRMPEHLKSRVEEAAAAEGLSVNAWLTRAVAAAIERHGPDPRGEPHAPRGSQRYKGWAR